MNRPNNVFRIPCSLSGSFFKYWFAFLKPYHKLTDREIDVIASLVKQRYILSKVITDSTVLDSVLMNEDTRNKVIKECGITLQYYQVILGKLRKNKVIIEGNKINPSYIPNIVEGEKGLKLLFYFDYKDDTSGNI